MKKIIIIIFVILPFLNTGYPQFYYNPTYILRAMNFSLNSPKNNFFEFDIYIQHTNPVTFLKIKTDTSVVKNISVSGVTAGRSYYVSVEHRNSIRTWSSLPLLFGNDIDTIIYDFTSDVTQSYGNNMTVVNGKACLYSGDINQDRAIDGEDKAMIDNDIYSFIAGNYVNTDLNWDGIVDGIDALICDNNASGYIQEISPSKF